MKTPVLLVCVTIAAAALAFAAPTAAAANACTFLNPNCPGIVCFFEQPDHTWAICVPPNAPVRASDAVLLP